MATAKQIINSIKPNISKVPTGKTQLGSAGYDNVRDDIEKVKKIREGSVEKTPTFDNDITNKKYVDDAVAAGGGGGITNLDGGNSADTFIAVGLSPIDGGDST